MSEGVKYEIADGIAILRIDNPPVNALSPHVRLALNELIERAAADANIRGVIVTGTGKTFIAGADIKLINQPRTDPTIGDFLAKVEAMKKPVVAAMQGTALGGGFEIALGCHARIALSGIRIGLPETTLGLIPGAGGTQRLPRLIGAAIALDMIASGRAISSAEALKLGAVDEEVPDNMIEAASALIDKLLKLPALPKARDRQPLGDAPDITAAKAAFDEKAVQLGKSTAPAVLAAIKAVADSFNTDFDDALLREFTAFSRLREGPDAQAMIHAFLAERGARHVRGVDRATARMPINTVAVIGAGTMGGGIAITLANAGYSVHIIDAARESLTTARTRITATYNDLVRRKRMDRATADRAISHFNWHTELGEGVASADLVIEAVYEDMGLKKKVFGELSRLAPKRAILASNTSYQDINVLARETDRPERVIGMHYFSPANIMKLLEVVRGRETSPETLATVLDVAARTDKVPVTVGVCYGFVGNRMLWQRTVQMQKLLLDGCTPRQIDNVLADFGFRMGPCQMQDLAGVDVAWRLRQARGERMEPVDTIADAGRWGQKVGKGYYLYPPGSRVGLDDPEVTDMISKVAARLEVVQRSVDNDEIYKRLLFPLINEGFRIIEEGIVERPGDIDVVYLNGYGWPRSKGGPMHHAEAYGLMRIANELDMLADTLEDEELHPTGLLRELAAKNGSLADIASGRQE